MKRQRLRENNDFEKFASKDQDESGDDETELFIRKIYQGFKEIATVEKVIEEGDTLQALSIRYHCPIAELKRLNNIHKENEIYARNSIKIPARPLSIPAVHESGNNSPNNGKLKAKTIDANTLKVKLSDQEATTVNAVIFNSNIIAKGFEPVESFFDADFNDEEVRLLPNSSSEVQMFETVTSSRWSCNGADADISWIWLIICIFIVIVAIPFIYVYYVVEHPEEFHHIKHHEHT